MRRAHPAREASFPYPQTRTCSSLETWAAITTQIDPSVRAACVSASARRLRWLAFERVWGPEPLGLTRRAHALTPDTPDVHHSWDARQQGAFPAWRCDDIFVLEAVEGANVRGMVDACAGSRHSGGVGCSGQSPRVARRKYLREEYERKDGVIRVLLDS